MARMPDGGIIPFGSPGGDVQPQAMLPVLLNVVVFGMTLQEAVETPSFALGNLVRGSRLIRHRAMIGPNQVTPGGGISC